MSGLHSDLVTSDLHGPFTYELDHDPTDDGPVRPHDYWLDLSSGPPWLVYRRNDANDTWDPVGGSGGGSSVIGSKGVRTTNQAIADSTDVAISFDANNFDGAGYLDPGGNPTRLTVPTGGIFMCGAAILWGATSGGTRTISIRRNGTDIFGVDEIPVAAGNDRQNPGITFALDNGDYIEFIVRQTSGGSLNLISDGGGTIAPAGWLIQLST